MCIASAAPVRGWPHGGGGAVCDAARARFINNLERATGQPIEPMGSATRRSIGVDSTVCTKRLSEAAHQERPNAEEGALLKELLQRIGTELELSPDQLAYAA